MQIPSRCSVADDLRWGAATLVALALCAVVAPLVPVAWLGGRWSGRTGSR